MGDRNPTTSKRIETWDATSRTLLVKRFDKRGDKELAAKKYSELEIGKPAQMGRGVSQKQVDAAIAEMPVARKVRSKGKPVEWDNGSGHYRPDADRRSQAPLPPELFKAH